MKIGSEGLAIIKAFEGLSFRAYQCPAGVWTIGYGHTKVARRGMIITEAVAEELLASDLAEFEKGVSAAVKVDLSQNEFDALVSFSFNVGLGNFKKSTLLKKINLGDKEGAAAEFPKWNKAGGQVLRGLIKRRNAEKLLWTKS